MCPVDASKRGFTKAIAKAEGVCYRGLAAVVGDDLGVCILIAKDKMDLLNRWDSITDVGIDFKEVKEVCLFMSIDTVALNAQQPSDSLTNEESNGTNQTAIAD